MRGFEIGRDQVSSNGDIKFITGSDVGKWTIKKLSFISKTIENQYKKNEDYFTGERILIRETGSELTVLYLETKLYCNRSLYSIKLRDKKYSTKFIAALLNSKLMQFYYQSKFKSDTDLFPKIRIAQVKLLPVKFSENQDIFEIIVALLMLSVLMSYQNAFMFFKSLLDAIVYELYLPDEIKAADCEVLKHLTNLPELKDGWRDEQKLQTIEKVYKELSNPAHPVSVAMEKVKTVPEVRIIEGLDKNE